MLLDGGMGCYTYEVTLKSANIGETLSSLVASWNKMMLEASHLLIINMIDHIRTKMMHDMASKKQSNKKWNTNLCPEMYDRL